jgi:hypothetical protein
VADDLTKSLQELNIDLGAVDDPILRSCLVALLNIIQQQARRIAFLEEENRCLKDEIARLKGEQGRPDVKANKNKDDSNTNYSSEKRRKKKKPRVPRQKMVEIDRTVPCRVDPATLPEDAIYKGTETKVIQDVIFRRDNVAFEREKYWSPSLNKVFYGPLPDGYSGYDFGPGVRSLVVVLYYATGGSEPKILELLASRGVEMSSGELSNLLIHDLDAFHQERDEVQEAGLESSPWHQIDDTSTRIDGVNHYCHILCNPLYTIYRTMPRKDRPTVLAVLRGLETPRYLVNDYAIAVAAELGVSGTVLGWFQERMPWDVEMDESCFNKKYEAGLSFVKKQPKRKLYEAAALAAYRAQTDVAAVRNLLGDDAPQFDGLTDERSLCWIHDGRQYARLTPFVDQFKDELAAFQDRYWDYYRELRAYRQSPSPAEAARLDQAFDDLFSTEVMYADLQDRISKTASNKEKLLQVLSHPELPLHNNDSELGARQRVRKRDVSFGPRTAAGARGWDTMQTVLATAKKLGISVYEYVEDRVTGRMKVPKLADVIRQKASEMNLGGSWGIVPSV